MHPKFKGSKTHLPTSNALPKGPAAAKKDSLIETISMQREESYKLAIKSLLRYNKSLNLIAKIPIKSLIL